MNLVPKPIALAVMIAVAQSSTYAYAETGKSADATTAVQTAPASAKSPVAIQSPTDWIVYDDTTYTPVADTVSRHLDAARKAFDAKDSKKAATEMHAVAEELTKQAALARKKSQSTLKADEDQLKTDTKLSQEIPIFMAANIKKVNAAVAGIEQGKIKTNADLDKVIDKAARADLERRWIVTDVSTWYPVNEEPQRHFNNAAAAFAKKDLKASATEIRKATSYLRLEASRTTGDARQALESSVTNLNRLAVDVEKGAVKDKSSMDRDFANAEHALALAHRANAAESWAAKDYNKAGYELKAAAHGLESAAGWAGGEAKAGSAAVVADTRALGDKLISGTNWTRDEVAKSFESLGNGLNELGHGIGAKQKAANVK